MGFRAAGLLSIGVAAVVALSTVVTPGTASAQHGATHHPVTGRQSRTSGTAIAGADVYLWSTHRSAADGSGCTLSFIVRSRSTGQPGALSAGHCVGTLDGGPTYAVHQTRSVGSNTTDPGLQLGAVAEGQYDSVPTATARSSG